MYLLYFLTYKRYLYINYVCTTVEIEIGNSDENEKKQKKYFNLRINCDYTALRMLNINYKI